MGLQSQSSETEIRMVLVLRILKKWKDQSFWMQVDAPKLPIFLAISTKFFIILAILLDFIPYISSWSLWKWHMMWKCSYLLFLWAKSLVPGVIRRLRMSATIRLTKSKLDFHTITRKKAPISKDQSRLVLVQFFWFWKVLEQVLGSHGLVLLIPESFRTSPGPVLPKKAKRLDQTRLLNTNHHQPNIGSYHRSTQSCGDSPMTLHISPTGSTAHTNRGSEDQPRPWRSMVWFWWYQYRVRHTIVSLWQHSGYLEYLK